MPDPKRPEDLTPEEIDAALVSPEGDEGTAAGEGSPEGTATDPPKKEESGSGEGPEGEGAAAPAVDPNEKRVKDAQSKMHDATTEAARYRERNRELEERLAKYEEPKPPKEMTQEELDQLAIDDPRGYAEHLVAVEKYRVDKEKWDADRKRQQDQDAHDASEAAKARTLDEFIAFASDVLGVEGLPGKPFLEQPKAIQEFYGTPEFQRTRDLIDSGSHPEFTRSDGSVSKRALRLAFEEANPDYTPPAQGRTNDKKRQLEDLKRGGSALSKAGDPGRGGSNVTPLSRLTPSQIANLPLAEQEKYLNMEEEEDA